MTSGRRCSPPWLRSARSLTSVHSPLPAWAPLAFELADALLLFAIFRLLVRDRRVAYLAVALYEGLIAWVGQDYLSPQAFGVPAVARDGVCDLALAASADAGAWDRRSDRAVANAARSRAWRLRRRPPGAQRLVALALVAAIYFVIVAAHQLTPYVVLAGVGALTLLDLVRPRWLLLLLAVIAGAYLAPRYGLISSNFGGLFSGGNPLQNASGSHGTYNAGGEALTRADRALPGRGDVAARAWRGAVRGARRSAGVLIPALLAFSPFLILGAQSYGGEAIYRVFLFSAPWCALLIAGLLLELRLPRRLRIRWPLTAVVCLAALFAGLQGLYGPVSVNAFTRSELRASQWLYAHAPRGSLLVLPDDNFPTLQAADYNSYDLQVMPSDPQLGQAWLNEGNLADVQTWLADLGHQSAYLVVSRSMRADAHYFGAPRGYEKLVSEIPSALHGAVVYHDADTTIYRLTFG